MLPRPESFYVYVLIGEQRENSMLTFETSSSRGVNDIVEKLEVCCPHTHTIEACSLEDRPYPSRKLHIV